MAWCLHLPLPAFFSGHVRVFPTMLEFFRPCWNFIDHVRIFLAMSDISDQTGIFQLFSLSTKGFFPPCHNFSPFPPYILGKIPSLQTEGIPAYSMQKKLCGWQYKYSPNCRGNHPLFVKPYPTRVLKHFPFFKVQSLNNNNIKQALLHFCQLVSFVDLVCTIRLHIRHALCVTYVLHIPFICCPRCLMLAR